MGISCLLVYDESTIRKVTPNDSGRWPCAVLVLVHLNRSWPSIRMGSVSFVGWQFIMFISFYKLCILSLCIAIILCIFLFQVTSCGFTAVCFTWIKYIYIKKYEIKSSRYYVFLLYTEVGTYCFIPVRLVCLSLCCEPPIHFFPAISIIDWWKSEQNIDPE